MRLPSTVQIVVVALAGCASVMAAEAPAAKPAKAAGGATVAPTASPAEPASTVATTTARDEGPIRELLQLSGSADTGKLVIDGLLSSLQQSMPKVPAEFWTGMRKELDPAEMVDLVVPIYAKHFTEEEIQALLAFYRSPIGRRLVAEQPTLIEESMTAGQAWSEGATNTVLMRLKAAGYR